jgi:cell division protein FtsB
MHLIAPRRPKHKAIILLCVSAVILLVVAAVYGDHGLIHLLRMQNEQRTLEHLVFQIGQNNEHLRERIRRLQTDDAYLQQLAHERLGLVKPGEIVYRVLLPTPGAPNQ